MASPRRRRRRWRSSRPATACASSRSTRRSAQGASKIRLGADGVRFLLILLKVITIFSPLRIFLPISARRVSGSARLRGVDDRDAVARHQFLRPADPDERRHLPRRPRLGTDLVAALRRTAIDDGAARAGHRPDVQRAREPAGAGRAADAARERAGPRRRRSVAGRHRRHRRRSRAASTRAASR